MTKDLEELGYDEALGELTRLVDELDDGTVDIDTLGQRFERAIQVIEVLEGRLLKTRQQIEKLTPRLQSAVDQAASD